MKNKITIVGANSFIARNFISLLKNELATSFKLSLYDYQESQNDGFENYQQVNILDKESVKKIDVDCDYLFVFAGKTGTLDGFTNFDDFIKINEIGLLNLLSICKDKGFTGKLIFPSSRLVYKGVERPLNEDDEKEFKTVYAMNKFACEQYLKQFNKVYGLSYCIFRICVPYGTIIDANPSYGTIGFMLNKAKSGNDITLYGDGSVKRTFTHMEDLCHLLWLGSTNEKCLNDVFNIGGECRSLAEIANIISKKYNVGVSYIPYPKEQEAIESGSTIFSDKKLQSILHYEFKNSVDKWTLKQ